MSWFSDLFARFKKTDEMAQARSLCAQMAGLLQQLDPSLPANASKELVVATEELGRCLWNLPVEQKAQLWPLMKESVKDLMQKGGLRLGLDLLFRQAGSENSLRHIPPDDVRALALASLAQAGKEKDSFSASILCRMMEWANQIGDAKDLRWGITKHVRDFLPRYIRDLDIEIRFNENQKPADRLFLSLKRRELPYLGEAAVWNMPKLLIESSRKDRGGGRKINLVGLDLLERLTYGATMMPSVCRSYIEAMDKLLSGDAFDKRCSAGRLSILAREVIGRVDSLGSQKDIAVIKQIKERMEEYILAAVPKTMCRDLRGAFETMARRAKKAEKTEADLVGMAWKTDEGFATVWEGKGKPPRIVHFKLANMYPEERCLFGVVSKELGIEPDIKKFRAGLDGFHAALRKRLAPELKS